MTTVQTYTVQGQMAYQLGNSRVLCSRGGCKLFQKKEGGVWRNGRHSYALDLIEKVKAVLAS